MRLPVSGDTVAKTVRVGSMVSSGVAAAWAWRSGRRITAALFAGIGLASAFLTQTVPGKGVAGVPSDYETSYGPDDDGEADNLTAALEDYCKNPGATVAKVNDIEKALKAQAADMSDLEARQIGIDGLDSVAKFRRRIASGNACTTR